MATICTAPAEGNTSAASLALRQEGGARQAISSKAPSKWDHLVRSERHNSQLDAELTRRGDDEHLGLRQLSGHVDQSSKAQSRERRKQKRKRLAAPSLSVKQQALSSEGPRKGRLLDRRWRGHAACRKRMCHDGG